MPKMGCWCGYVFQFDIEPEDYELCLFPQKFIFDIIERWDKEPVTCEEFADATTMNGRDVHPCPKCGRVYFETEPRSGVYEPYVKEDRRGGLWPLRKLWKRTAWHLERVQAMLRRR